MKFSRPFKILIDINLMNHKTETNTYSSVIIREWKMPSETLASHVGVFRGARDSSLP